MKKTFFFIAVFSLLHTALYAQCAYTGTPLTQAGSPIIFCIDNSNTQTVTTNAGQYVLVNVIKGYNYTFSVPDIAGFAGNENLTIYNATNTTTSLANSTGASGVSITWTATLSGQIKILLSRGACSNDGTTGGVMALKLNTIGDTNTSVNDLETAAGTNSWIGHIYNAGGATPEPFTSANYAGYYLEPSPTFTQAFGGSTACFPVYSNGLALASIYTEGFAVRYKMANTAMTGCYIIKLTGDDGMRLSINGVSVFNAWKEQASTTYDNVLVNLSSGDQLVLDYYENAGANTVDISFTAFNTSTNTITPLATTVCSGGATQLLTGSSYVPTNTPISGTNIAYQWQKGSVAGGPFTDISGATAQNYTPPAISTSTTQTDYYVRVVKPTSSLSTSCSTSNIAAITTTGVLANIMSPILNVCNTLTSGSLGGNVPASGSTGAWTLISGPGTVVFSTPTAAASTTKVSMIGTYVFRWKVTSGSCSNYADVTVNYGVTPTVNTPPVILCIGSTFQLTPSTGGTWSSNNAVVASVSATGLITGISGGTGVTFTFTSSLAGSCAATTSAVTVPSLPSVSHDNTSIAVCQGYSQGVLTAVTTGGLFPFTYQWFLNGIAISSATTNTYTPGVLSTPGTYSYTVVVTDACSKTTSSVAKVITVLDDPFPPTAIMSPIATTVCVGTSLTLTNPVLGSGGTGTQNFEYSTTSATTGFSTTLPNISATAAGTYTIWIRTNPSGSGCNNSTATAYSWVVKNTPTATITGGGKICLPSTFPAVSIALTGTSPWNITYTNGTPVTVTGITTNPYTFTPSIVGNYTVTAISDANCTGTFSGSAIVVSDTTSPIITCPVAQNISGCSTAAITGNIYSTTAISISPAQFITAGGSSSDDCAVTNITYQDSAVGTCPIVVTRIWKAYDAAGNASTCNQIINIQDTTKPVLAGQGANYTSCTSAYSFTAPTATDNCDSAPIISFVDTSSLGTNPNANNYTRTWKAKDSCGNESLTVSQTVLVQIMMTPLVTVVNNCGMGTTTLSTNALGSLLWSTGETTTSITVSTAGSYTVKSTLNGCVSALGTGVATPLLSPIIP